MAEKNITRKAALEFAYASIQGILDDGGYALAEDNAKATEVQEVLNKMLAQLNKPRKAAVSKARLMNENLAREIVAAMPAEGLTSKQIVGLGNLNITTTQKAAAVMRVAEEMGLAVKVKDGKKISYKPAKNDGEDA